jgi:hypothetical protein
MGCLVIVYLVIRSSASAIIKLDSNYSLHYSIIFHSYFIILSYFLRVHYLIEHDCFLSIAYLIPYQILLLNIAFSLELALESLAFE